MVYSTVKNKFNRTDIDNILKPTLDGLMGIAYKDDRQVRGVSLTLFDRNTRLEFGGRVEIIGKLLSGPDIMVIAIYSNTRLNELGGEGAVSDRRKEEYLRQLSTRIGVKI